MAARLNWCALMAWAVAVLAASAALFVVVYAWQLWKLAEFLSH